MYRCPITYFAGNLIFNTDKSVWAAYKLTGYDYDYLDDEQKIQILYKQARFLTGIAGDAQILIVPVEQDNKSQFKYLVEKLDKEDLLYEQAKYHAEQTESYLERIRTSQGDTNDYRSYVLVKLAHFAENELVSSLKSAFQYFVKSPVNAVNFLMELDSKDILMSRINRAKKAANDWFFNQNQKIMLIELQNSETQWLFRRLGFRGLNERVKLFQRDMIGSVDWQPSAKEREAAGERVISPYGYDTVNLFSGSIHPEGRLIRVEHDRQKVSWQTFLTLTNIPDQFEYPGIEWLYMLQQSNMQAEVCIHIKSIDYKAAQKKLDGKKQEIKSQIEHVMEAGGDVPEDLYAGREYADAMEAEMKAMQEPLLNASITICVASDDRETLEKRVTLIKNEYEDLRFAIERPLADQLDLFMQCIPTVGCIVKDYVMPMTPLTLASAVIGASHELGDKEGPYIGTTGAEGKPVYLELGRACLLNKSAAATFYGNLGYGKSFNANLLIALNILYGGYGLIFDPKAERSHWETELGILNGLITTVTLSPDVKNKGKLDPYNVYEDDVKAADELALNVLSELLKLAPTSIEYTAIMEAQRIMTESGERPSMRRLASLLGSFPEEDELCKTGRFLARRLKLQADSGMSQLLFGDGTEEAISLNNRLNILQIDNLELPSPETPREAYSAEENISVVLFSVISHFAKKFAMVKRPVFKLILFDESWMLGKTVAGVKLFDFLTRMGRSLYTGCIFNGHSVLDLPSQAIRNTISYKFCFHTDSDEEAERMCAYMGMDASVKNKETLKSLRNGECMFQDLEGHVGVLRFDAVFQDLIDVFSTTPKTKDSKGSETINEGKEIDTATQWEEDQEDWTDGISSIDVLSEEAVDAEDGAMEISMDELMRREEI